jgi:putative metalloprotease
VITPQAEAAFANVAAATAIPSGDRRATFRVAGIANKLNAASGGKANTTLAVAESVRAAIPLPADRIVVTEGLASALSDDELAAAIAHQMGHLALHHPLEKVKAMDLGQGKSGQTVLANWTPDEPSADVGTLSAKLFQARYTPEEEQKADSYASDLLPKAGYKAAAIASVRATLAKKSETQPGPMDYVTQHPVAN